jgi:hypothetical protein
MPGPLATEFEVARPARQASFEDFVAHEGRWRFAQHRAALKEPDNG